MPRSLKDIIKNRTKIRPHINEGDDLSTHFMRYSDEDIEELRMLAELMNRIDNEYIVSNITPTTFEITEREKQSIMENIKTLTGLIYQFERECRKIFQTNIDVEKSIKIIKAQLDNIIQKLG